MIPMIVLHIVLKWTTIASSETERDLQKNVPRRSEDLQWAFLPFSVKGNTTDFFRKLKTRNEASSFLS